MVNPLVAGPETNDPSELKVDPCAAHKKEDFVLTYSTVAPACGQTEETAKKLDTAFPEAILIKITPFFAIKSLTALNSESNLTVKEFEPELCPGFELGVDPLGAGFSSLAQAAAKHETHTAAKPPVIVFKNLVLFIAFLSFFPLTKKQKNCS